MAFLTRITQRVKKGLPGTRSKSRTKKCSEGYIYRKPYMRSFRSSVRQKGYSVHKKGGITYRIYPKASRVIVRGQCVKDRGLPGKGPKLFGDLKRGELIKYGYNYHLPGDFRRNSLKKAINEYGPLKVYHKLDAVAKLTAHTSKKAHAVFKKDADWVRTTYLTKV